MGKILIEKDDVKEYIKSHYVVSRGDENVEMWNKAIDTILEDFDDWSMRWKKLNEDE